MENAPPPQQPVEMTVDQAYAQAVEHFKAGRFIEADRLCSAIVQADPNHLDAINIIGVIAQNIGRHEFAIDCFQRAIALDGGQAMLRHNLGISHYQLGRWAEAEAALRAVLTLDPDHQRALRDLNLVLNRAPPVPYPNDWNKRKELAVSCRDCDALPRVPDAGAIQEVDGVAIQVMHNGTKVVKDGYYNPHLTDIIQQLKGFHEPQEEKAFAEVLAHIPPGGVMLELGAYWAYYSLWFNRAVPGAVNHIIEPLADNLEVGRTNFRLNQAAAVSTQAYIGAVSSDDAEIPTVAVDDYVELHGIPHLAILHSDIQGAELKMLEGASRTIAAGKIDYIFISTHGDDALHHPCIAFLKQRNFRILADHTMRESYSYDGLIVAQAPHVEAPGPIMISKRTA